MCIITLATMEYARRTVRLGRYSAGARSKARLWAFSAKDIAVAFNTEEWQVRRWIRSDRPPFDPTDLESICRAWANR